MMVFLIEILLVEKATSNQHMLETSIQSTSSTDDRAVQIDRWKGAFFLVNRC